MPTPRVNNGRSPSPRNEGCYMRAVPQGDPLLKRHMSAASEPFIARCAALPVYVCAFETRNREAPRYSNPPPPPPQRPPRPILPTLHPHPTPHTPHANPRSFARHHSRDAAGTRGCLVNLAEVAAAAAAAARPFLLPLRSTSVPVPRRAAPLTARPTLLLLLLLLLLRLLALFRLPFHLVGLRARA